MKKQIQKIGILLINYSFFINIYFYYSSNSKNSTDASVSEDKESKQKRILRENARLEKWNKMLSNFEEFYKNKFNKLKERTRKGVPDSLRGLIWQVLADINVYRNDEKNQNLYHNLVSEEESDLETESVILRDIDRTFPKHTFFKDKYGLG
jgi:Tfp pilus tip-associated adhesin PilY1